MKEQQEHIEKMLPKKFTAVFGVFTITQEMKDTFFTFKFEGKETTIYCRNNLSAAVGSRLFTAIFMRLDFFIMADREEAKNEGKQYLLRDELSEFIKESAGRVLDKYCTKENKLKATHEDKIQKSLEECGEEVITGFETFYSESLMIVPKEIGDLMRNIAENEISEYGAYKERKHGQKVYIHKDMQRQTRFALYGDPFLFAGDIARFEDNYFSRGAVLSHLQKEWRNLLPNVFTGQEFTFLFFIQAMFHKDPTAQGITIDVEQMIKDMGIEIKSRTDRARKVKKYSGMIYDMQHRDVIFPTVDGSEFAFIKTPINPFKCKMAYNEKPTAQRKHGILYITELAAFLRQGTGVNGGFAAIPLHPLKHIQHNLQKSEMSANNALKAACLILCDVENNREIKQRKFALKTLSLDNESFSRHSEDRAEAIEVLRAAFTGYAQIEAEIDSLTVKIE